MKFIMLNDFLPYIGMGITLIAWRCERFNTKPLSINLAMMTFVFIWLSLYLADRNPNFTPTFGTTLARTLFIIVEFLIVGYVHSVTAKMRKQKAREADKDIQLTKQKAEIYRLKGFTHVKNL